MAAIPQQLSTAQAIARAYENGHRASGMKADDRNRPHLGASLIGHECDRAIWYTFRWAEREQFDGRMLRLFDTGHMAEHRFVSDLRATGATVHDVEPGTGKQWRISGHGGHFGGSMDGCAVGIIEAPKTWHVTEFKTHSQKSFDKLKKEGVRKAKPRHYDQMVVYMGKTGMTRALYLAVNKNTDEMYSERIEEDKDRFKVLEARALRIIKSTEPPAGISTDPSWFECKYCSFKDICHGDQVPQVNCRTCAHSEPVMDGSAGAWRCAAGNTEIDLATQYEGCLSHRIIPIFLQATAKPVDYHNGDVVYETKTGERFANGEGPGACTSQEIRDFAVKDALPIFTAAKVSFPTATVVA